MTAPEAKDPLDALQLLLDDVLVQTGKALRASRRDGKGNTAQAHGSLQAKLPYTMDKFHKVLNDIDHNIIGAKSVLLRDLNQLQAKKSPAAPAQPQQSPETQKQPEQLPEPPLQQQSQPQSQPVEPQTKSPIAIDIDSSPPPAPRVPSVPAEEATSKPMAPFPDMGMNMGDSGAPDFSIKDEDLLAQPPLSAVPDGPDSKPSGSNTPGLSMDVKPPVAENGTDDASAVPNSEFNFTDMEFTLAPTGSENQGQPSTTSEPSFDLTSFAPAESGEELLSLDDIMAPGMTGQASDAMTAAQGQGQDDIKMDDPTGAKFDDMFGPDAGATDGLDFDFSLGDGLGGDTFDDMMNDRDDTYDMMEHGDVDQAFFGLNGQDET